MMMLRPFRSGLAPDYAGTRGTRFEPGHRVRVRAYVEPDQIWATCAYNRKTARFWLFLRGDWFELATDAVRWWTQMPPWCMRDPEALRREVEFERRMATGVAA